MDLCAPLLSSPASPNSHYQELPGSGHCLHLSALCLHHHSWSPSTGICGSRRSPSIQPSVPQSWTLTTGLTGGVASTEGGVASSKVGRAFCGAGSRSSGHSYTLHHSILNNHPNLHHLILWKEFWLPQTQYSNNLLADSNSTKKQVYSRICIQPNRKQHLFQCCTRCLP